MQSKQKVQCYITRERGGSLQVLVFEHVDYPDAGVQVPAGSVEPDETQEEAALREAREESGILELEMQSYIGKFHWFNADRNEDNERYVFHLITSQTLPERWEHIVSAGTEDKGLRFTYYWLDCDVAAQILSGNQGDYLHYLESP